jgi:hypothetical protein
MGTHVNRWVHFGLFVYNVDNVRGMQLTYLMLFMNPSRALFYCF